MGALGTVALIAALVVGFFFGHLAWSMHRMLRQLEEGGFTFEDPPGPPTPEFAGRLAEIERAGFAIAADQVVRLYADNQRLALLWRADGLLVELSEPLDRKGRVKVSILTPLAPGSGYLATQDVYGFLTLPLELKQVFPDAAIENMVAEHERALTWLASEGLGPRAFAATDALDLYQRILRRAGAEHPRNFRLWLRLTYRELQGEVFADEGSIVDAPTTPDKLRAILAAPGDPFWD